MMTMMMILGHTLPYYIHNLNLFLIRDHSLQYLANYMQ